MTLRAYFHDLLERREARIAQREADDVLDHYEQLRAEPPEDIAAGWRTLRANPVEKQNTHPLWEWLYDQARTWGAPDVHTARMIVQDTFAEYGHLPDTADSYSFILSAIRARCTTYTMFEET